MAEEPSPLVTIRYRDAKGFLRELLVSRAQARVVGAVRQATRREAKKWRAQHISFTDAKIDGGRLVEKPAPKTADDGGYPWEGPRFHFAILLGSGPTWPLPDPVDGLCPGCGGGQVPAIAYCLACDRSGQDQKIDPPSRRDLERRRGPVKKVPAPAQAVDGTALAGGLGNARPRAKMVVKKKSKAQRKGKAESGTNSFDLKKLRAELDQAGRVHCGADSRP